MRFLFATWVLLLIGGALPGAEVRTANFVVTAKSEKLAKKVAKAAEELREAKAVAWLGKKLPDWSQRTPLTFETGDDMALSGSTTFTFDGGKATEISMIVRGTSKRAFDSVLPHEMTHAVLGTHFGRPIPRWADEGMAQYEEHPDVRRGFDSGMISIIDQKRGIRLVDLFVMKNYPDDMSAFYHGGYSVTRFLVEKKGRRKFIEFLTQSYETTWTKAVKDHYGYESLGSLQDDWVKTIYAEDRERREQEKKREAGPKEGKIR